MRLWAKPHTVLCMYMLLLPLVMTMMCTTCNTAGDVKHRRPCAGPTEIYYFSEIIITNIILATSSGSTSSCRGQQLRPFPQRTIILQCSSRSTCMPCLLRRHPLCAMTPRASVAPLATSFPSKI